MNPEPKGGCRAIRGPRFRLSLREAGMTVALGAALLLAGCGPQTGDLEKGEEAQGELEALALHRQVRLAYGGAHRWTPRPREGDTSTPRETAIAHVFVQSEGGRWFWLQHELVSRGAAFARPRRDNHARAEELVALENDAREAERGLWERREYRALNPNAAAALALEADVNCFNGAAPWRIVEARIGQARTSAGRAALTLDGAPEEAPFSIVVFGDSLTEWDGAALASLTGARIRARGPLGVFHGEPQLCLDHSAQLEVLAGE